MTLKITTDSTAELFRDIDALVKSRVLIGIPDTGAERQPEDGEEGTPPSNALIGYLMETGAPDKNMPARATLIPGIEKASERIEKQLAKAAVAAISGDSAGVDAGLAAAGLIGQAAVRAEITDGTFAPLADRTIKARLRRGRTSTKPLVDTSQFRSAVTYVVARRGV
jgi:hypothetical protein